MSKGYILVQCEQCFWQRDSFQVVSVNGKIVSKPEPDGGEDVISCDEWGQSPGRSICD